MRKKLIKIALHLETISKASARDSDYWKFLSGLDGG